MQIQNKINNEPTVSNQIMNMPLEKYTELKELGLFLRERYFKKRNVNYEKMIANRAPEGYIFGINYLYTYALNKFLLTNTSHYSLYYREFDICEQQDKEVLSIFITDPTFEYLKRFIYLNNLFENEVCKDLVLRDGVYYKKTGKKILKKNAITKNTYVYEEMLKTYGFYSSYLLTLENQVHNLSTKLVKDLLKSGKTK